MPKVAVIIPCHNGIDLVGTAIESVLAQTFGDVEIMVADDRSVDGSAEKVAAYGEPVRLIRVDNGNTQATRNAAIAATDAPLIALLDQDDRWHPEKLAEQVAALDRHPDAALCYTDTRGLDAAGRELSHMHNPLFIPESQVEAFGKLLEVNYMAASTVVIRRSVLESVGMLDPRFHLAGDWELWLRALERYSAIGLPRVLIDYVWHGSNESRRAAAMLRESIAVQIDALARARTNPRWASGPAMKPYLRRANRKLAGRYSELGKLASAAGDRPVAIENHRRALALRPLQARNWGRLLRAAF